MGPNNDGRKQVFVCHSSKDARVASQAVKILEELGIGCWVAPRDVPAGHQYNQAVIDGIENCSVVLLVLSENSNKSPHVEVEIERAFNYQKLIVPLRMREVLPSKRLEYFVSSAQWVDAFASPLRERLTYVASVVKAVEEKRDVPTVQPERPTLAGRLIRGLEATRRYAVPVALTAIAVVLFGGYLAVPVSTQDSKAVRSAVESIDRKLETVAADSRDPRKELNKLGWSWSQEEFGRAIADGEWAAIELFLAGGMDLPRTYAGGSPLAYAIAKGVKNIDKLVSLYVSKGFDPNEAFTFGILSVSNPSFLERQIQGGQNHSTYGTERLTWLIVAIWAKNEVAIKALLANGAKKDVKGSYGIPMPIAVQHWETMKKMGASRGPKPVEVQIDPLVEAKKSGSTVIAGLLQ